MSRVDDATRWARQHHLDLRASREAVPIDAIVTPWHGPAFVSPVFLSLFRGKELWPVRMPLIVAACEQTECAVIDGSHRLTAAAQAGCKVIPIIAVPRATVDALVDYFRPNSNSPFPFADILGVFKTNALVRENIEKERAWGVVHG